MDDFVVACHLRHFVPAEYQPNIARRERKSRGVYYTPLEIVQLMVDLTLGPIDSCKAPQVLDPACGAGEFLVAMQKWLSARSGNRVNEHSIFGVDIDAQAVATSRQRMKCLNEDFAGENICVGDALNAGLLPSNSFDVVIGNPPYVNIRQLAKTQPRKKIDELQRQYRTARGNFDLYVLFIERAIELLRSGGRCGMILPNKWATLDYARECRKLLLRHTTIEHVIDLSEYRVFAGVSVYPQVVIFRKETPAAEHYISVSAFRRHRIVIRQSSLSENSICLTEPLDLESRVTTVPLGQVAKLSCGTAGYAARKIAGKLLDVPDESESNEGTADFVTSGNIRRYAVELGRVRYLNRHYVRPRLPLSIPELTTTKRQLFRRQKIVIAGMSRRLQAAWDDRGLALGVQVFAANEFQVDPFYLLALLNSKLFSFLFSTRYAAKRLSGGYLAVNKGQLAQLPVRLLTQADSSDRNLQRCLSDLAASWKPIHELKIDRLVYQLYGLMDDEISRVESHFSERHANAA
jgi:adenine-specific DNA-methyltransferase